MKKGMTELVFILDKSGSMAGLEKDTIGGFNSMLKKQKQVDGECIITTVLFDNQCELLHDRTDIRAVNDITENEYAVGGSTALLDAIGGAITKIDKAMKHTSSNYRAQNVMFVIITDGEENSSREFSSQKVKAMIEERRTQGWEFIFLGANIDAVETAEKFGIDRHRAANYHADSKGVETNFRAMASAISTFREESAVPTDWDEAITSDFAKRGK